MFKFKRKRTKKLGLPPGEVVHVGEIPQEPGFISHIEFDQTRCEEKRYPLSEMPKVKLRPYSMQWIDVTGLHQTDLIMELGHQFNWHFLVMEDIVNTDHQPKLEEFEDYIFCILKFLTYHTESREIREEHYALVMGENYVVTFHEQENPILTTLSKRIKLSKSKFRRNQSDYLAYAIIDVIVDYYYQVLEQVGERIVQVDHELISHPTEATLNEVYRLRQENLFFRRMVWPLKDLTFQLIKCEGKLLDDDNAVYWRDLQDHVNQIIEHASMSRETIMNMLDMYMSQVSQRLNEIMKVLTLFASIFIPLTFIAGVYGMNFAYMPELNWKYGYLMVWGVMLAVVGGMLYFFKRKRWF